MNSSLLLGRQTVLCMSWYCVNILYKSRALLDAISKYNIAHAMLNT